MGVFNEDTKIKIFKGASKVKKAYLGKTKIYSSGNIVTYVVDSGTTYSEEVDEGVSILAPATFVPAKSGWTFLGWRKDTVASGSVLSSEVMGDEQVTLYAVFTQGVALTYYDGNTTAKSKSGTRYYNNGNINNPGFTMSQTAKSGWTARGWATGTAGNAAVVYSNGALITISANTTIYGLYYQNVTQTFKSYNSTQTVTGTRYYNSAGNTTNASVTAPTGASYSGWSWRGWSASGSTAANAGVSYANGGTISGLTGANTYYGLYEQAVTLTYYDNSASPSYKYGTRYYNAYGNTTNPSFTMTQTDDGSWTERGWSTSSTANASIVYANGATITLTGNMTIYGCYEQTIYLYYNGNGAGSGSVATQSGTRYWNAGNVLNPTFTLASNGFARSYYNFTGWNLGAVGARVTLSASATAYAQWVAYDSYTAFSVEQTNGWHPYNWTVTKRDTTFIPDSVPMAIWVSASNGSESDDRTDYIYNGPFTTMEITVYGVEDNSYNDERYGHADLLINGSHVKHWYSDWGQWGDGKYTYTLTGLLQNSTITIRRTCDAESDCDAVCTTGVAITSIVLKR